MSGISFQQGEGSWLGSAEVYDASGRYVGEGHDSRVVRRNREDGTVEVTVSFAGPFRLSGSYVISDHGDHRLYLGPLNYGYAESFGDDLIDTNNYWPDLGLSQRLCLMVLPGGTTQLSLALLSRGEQAAYAVVGEYSRPSSEDGGAGSGPASGAGGAGPAGDARPLLERPGTWSGTLRLLGAGGDDRGTTNYSEQVTAGGGERDGDGRLVVLLKGSGFADDAEFALVTGGVQRWTPGGGVVGSESLWGGRALAGNLIFGGDRLRLWRREVARRDGSCKGVLHTWYRGGNRVGVAHGVLDFTP